MFTSSAYTYRVGLVLVVLLPLTSAQSAAATSTVESCVDSASGGGVCSGAEEKAKATFDAFSQWVDYTAQDASRFFDHIFTQNEEDIVKKVQNIIIDRSKEDTAKLQPCV